MRGIACVLGMAAMVCSLPVRAEQAGVSPQLPSPANALEACNLALSRAREVDRTLRTVVDLESGKQAAEALSHTLRHMQMALAELEKLPPLSAGKSRELEQKMRDLTHLTQGYMPMVQRLVEVNAYGSEELIAVFHYYKLTVSRHKSEEESPMNRACVELADMVEDVCCAMCKARRLLPLRVCGSFCPACSSGAKRWQSSKTSIRTALPALPPGLACKCCAAA